jgi:hypothetical protein
MRVGTWSINYFWDWQDGGLGIQWSVGTDFKWIGFDLGPLQLTVANY